MIPAAADRWDTPLCPLRGHLPLKGGEGRLPHRRAHKNRFDVEENLTGSSSLFYVSILSEELRQAPVSPLEGEMPALAGRGGYAATVLRTEIRLPYGRRPMPHQKIPKHLRTNAINLRSGMTDAEKKLWNVLRAHRLEGLAFRRQMPIAGNIVDFSSPSHRLIVELDGSQHAETGSLRQDRRRDQTFMSLGWTVLRFWNAEISTDLDGVCRKVLDACGKESC